MYFFFSYITAHVISGKLAGIMPSKLTIEATVKGKTIQGEAPVFYYVNLCCNKNVKKTFGVLVKSE